ncbi:hypothetical protein [Corynebacterium tapiri]|uniref:hypothetical protein n=1 Tax=Corynebacterium tapiri TaxID=1448266 RepID=UPI003CCC497B
MTVAARPGVIPQPERPDPSVVEFKKNATGSQATLLRLDDGSHVGTATERFARPALSLAKLYVAYYVFEHGTEDEQYDAVMMISSSDDEEATRLYEKYPESIDRVADEFNLYSTRGSEEWGTSVTSTYDVTRFIAALIKADKTHPILVAMALSGPVAADGYGQDFGTAKLPGAQGTKWGWSNDLSLHSSVTFGENYVAAAAVTGSADDLTAFAEVQLGKLAEQASS